MIRTVFFFFMILWWVENETEFQPALQQCNVNTKRLKENFTQILYFWNKANGPGVEVHTSGDKGKKLLLGYKKAPQLSQMGSTSSDDNWLDQPSSSNLLFSFSSPFQTEQKYFVSWKCAGCSIISPSWRQRWWSWRYWRGPQRSGPLRWPWSWRWPCRPPGSPSAWRRRRQPRWISALGRET